MTWQPKRPSQKRPLALAGKPGPGAIFSAVVAALIAAAFVLSFDAVVFCRVWFFGC